MGEEKKEIIEKEKHTKSICGTISSILAVMITITYILGVGLGVYLLFIQPILYFGYMSQSDSVYEIVPYDTGGVYEVGEAIASPKITTTTTRHYITLAWMIDLVVYGESLTRFNDSLNPFGNIVTLTSEDFRPTFVYKGIIGNSKIINDQYYNSSEIDVGGAYVLVISKVNPDSSIVGEWKLKEGEDK